MTAAAGLGALAVAGLVTPWRAWRDGRDPSRILEQFVVSSWDEHLRQRERVITRDQGRLDRLRALTDPAFIAVGNRFHWA
jgi:Transmembrane secretion effector